jgi:hypothetical protein
VAASEHLAARLSRRAVVLGGAGLLAGCTGPDAHSSAPRRSTSASPSGSGSTGPTAGATGTVSGSPEATASHDLPHVTRWQPNAGDLVPGAKLAAVRAIERRGNGPRTALQVLDAQYGGLLAASASVLVVCRTWRRPGSHVVPGGRTFDVRLVRASTGWRVTAVHPSVPGPARRLTPDARAVLATDRIVLPPAAAADVRSGHVHESVLAAMRRLADRYVLAVSVVRSGHPLLVFGTDRPSDHPQGRAFDTFRIDGHLVVDPRTPRRLVTGYMEAAARAGSYNVGGPYLLGAAPQWFSDRTHHDHVHAGFST